MVDGRFVVVGSANMDIRSKELNEENVLGILDPALAARMEKAFRRDLALSEEITLEKWNRPRLLQAGGRARVPAVRRAVLTRDPSVRQVGRLLELAAPRALQVRVQLERAAQRVAAERALPPAGAPASRSSCARPRSSAPFAASASGSAGTRDSACSAWARPSPVSARASWPCARRQSAANRHRSAQAAQAAASFGPHLDRLLERGARARERRQRVLSALDAPARLHGRRLARQAVRLAELRVERRRPRERRPRLGPARPSAAGRGRDARARRAARPALRQPHVGAHLGVDAHGLAQPLLRRAPVPAPRPGRPRS